MRTNSSVNADESGSAATQRHPLDVRGLVERGVIRAVRVRPDTFPLECSVTDVLFPRLGLRPVEQAVYVQYWRHSHGRGLNCAQVSVAELCRLCNVSHSTARAAVHTLCRKGCLEQVRPGIQHDAPIYRVLPPGQIAGCGGDPDAGPADVPLALPRSDSDVVRFADLLSRPRAGAGPPGA